MVQSLQLVASQTPNVNVTLGTREQMEPHARSALSTNTKKAWGLLPAPIVHQTLSLQLAVSLTLHVNVTLDTQEKMEKYARSAVSSNTK